MRRWTIYVNILCKQHVGALMELLCNFVVNGMNKLNYKFAAWFFTFWFLSYGVQMIYVGILHYAFWVNAIVWNMQLISKFNMQLFDLFPWATKKFQVLPSFIAKKTLLSSTTRRAHVISSKNVMSSLKKCTLHAIMNYGGYIARFWTRWGNVQNTL